MCIGLYEVSVHNLFIVYLLEYASNLRYKIYNKYEYKWVYNLFSFLIFPLRFSSYLSSLFFFPLMCCCFINIKFICTVTMSGSRKVRLIGLCIRINANLKPKKIIPKIYVAKKLTLIFINFNQKFRWICFKVFTKMKWSIGSVKTSCYCCTVVRRISKWTPCNQ